MTETKQNQNNDIQEIRMLAALQKLEVFVEETSRELVVQVNLLKENNQTLKSTAYNMAKVPDDMHSNTRAAVMEEYKKIVPRIQKDFADMTIAFQRRIDENIGRIERSITKSASAHRIIVRNLILTALIAGMVAIGGTWGALKLFKAHTSILTAKNVTTSGSVHLFDMTGRHIESVLEKQKK